MTFSSSLCTAAGFDRFSRVSSIQLPTTSRMIKRIPTPARAIWELEMPVAEEAEWDWEAEVDAGAAEVDAVPVIAVSVEDGGEAEVGSEVAVVSEAVEVSAELEGSTVLAAGASLRVNSARSQHLYIHIQLEAQSKEWGRAERRARREAEFIFGEDLPIVHPELFVIFLGVGNSGNMAAQVRVTVAVSAGRAFQVRKKSLTDHLKASASCTCSTSMVRTFIWWATARRGSRSASRTAEPGRDEDQPGEPRRCQRRAHLILTPLRPSRMPRRLAIHGAPIYSQCIIRPAHDYSARVRAAGTGQSLIAELRDPRELTLVSP